MSVQPLLITESLSAKIRNMSFLCACMVVMMHVDVALPIHSVGWWIVNLLQGNGISTIAVPWFFLVSGFLLCGKITKSGWYGVELRKRVKSLLIPYVSWNVLYWLFVCSLAFVCSFMGSHFGEMTFRDGLHFSTWLQVLGVFPLTLPQLPFLWFLRSLMLAVILSPLLLMGMRKFGRWGVGIVLVLLIVEWYLPEFLPPSDDWRPRFCAHGWIEGVTWFFIGICLRLHGNALLIKRPRCMGIICAFIGGGGYGSSVG